jgi:hypothetical protein
MEVPLTRVVVTTTHLEEDGSQEEFGRMGLGAARAIGGVEVGQVEPGDGLFDGSGEMVRREGGFDVTASGVVLVPGWCAEARSWVVARLSIG